MGRLHAPLLWRRCRPRRWLVPIRLRGALGVGARRWQWLLILVLHICRLLRHLPNADICTLPSCWMAMPSLVLTASMISMACCR